MRLLIDFPPDQEHHLRHIKSTHNIPMSAYIRNLIKNDIEHRYYSISEEYTTKRTITYTHRQQQQSTQAKQWASINQELAPLLAKRRSLIDKHTIH